MRTGSTGRSGERSALWDLWAPLVGRTGEFERPNWKVLGTQRGGCGECQLVSGETGMGESRLVSELRCSLDDSREWPGGRGFDRRAGRATETRRDWHGFMLANV